MKRERETQKTRLRVWAKLPVLGIGETKRLVVAKNQQPSRTIKRIVHRELARSQVPLLFERIKSCAAGGMAGATAYNGPRVECSMHRMGSLMMLLCVLRFHDD